MKTKVLRHLFSVLLLLLLGGSTYAADNRRITYQGRILRPDGTSLTGLIPFTLRIYSPSPSSCLLWAEGKDVELSTGAFSVEIGDVGYRLPGPSGGGAADFQQVFTNNPGLTISSSECAGGSTDYTPTATDDRILRVSIFDDGQSILAYNGPIKSIPFALETQAIGGYSVNYLFKISGGVSSDKATGVFSQAGADLLWEIAHNRDFGGQRLLNLGAPTAASDAATKAYVDGVVVAASGVASVSGSAGQILVANGTTNAVVSLATTGISAGTVGSSNFVPVIGFDVFGRITSVGSTGVAGGTVTQVNSGTGLTGGPINGSGTLSLADTAVSPGSYGSANSTTSFTVDQQGRLTAAGSTLIAINGSQVVGGTIALAQIPDLDASKIVSGTFANARLPVSGVAAGTFSSNNYIPSFTVDSFGRLVSVGSNAISFPALQWTNVVLGVNYSSGSVGIGQASPATMLDVAGAIRIANDGTACAAGLSGAIRYNAGFVEYCNGAGPGWQTLGISGSGVQSFNGLTANSQLFAVGSAGTLAAFTSGGSLHTLNIPLASTAGAAGGLLSNADYLTLTTGTIPSGRIADLDTAKITSGTLGSNRGGTGVDGSAAGQGQLLIGTGSGFSLGTLSSGAGISIVNQAGSITISATNSGSVTQVNTGAGLVGGPITSVGTISLGTTGIAAGSVGSASYIPQIVYDIYGRITAVGSTAVSVTMSALSGTLGVSKGGTGLDASTAANGSLLIGNGSGFTLGSLVASNGIQLSVGAGSVAISSNAAVSATGNTILMRDGSGNTTSAQATATSLRLDNAGAYVTLTNPIGSNYSMVLPADIGTPGQVLRTNGTNQLSWVTAPVSGGTFLAASGTQTAPGFAFQADPDTGLWNPGANTIAISTQGTTRISVNSIGQVGIGTTTPTSALDIQSVAANSAGVSTALRITQNVNSSGTGGYTSLLINADEVSTGSGDNLLLDLQRGGSSRFSVDRSGDVNGGAFTGTAFTGNSFRGNLFTSTGSMSITPGGANSSVTINPTGSGRTTFANGNVVVSAGSVGIGTVAPSALLSLQGPATGNGMLIRAGESDGVDYILRLQDQDGTATAMNVDVSGAVSLPNDIDATLADGGSLILGPINGLNIAIDGNEILARNNGATSTLYLQNAGGQVEIGGPTNVLVDDGLAGGSHTLFRAYRSGGSSYGVGLGYLADGSSEVAAMIRPTGTGTPLAFANDSGVERMRITSGGSLGLGTTTPLARLDVNGGIRSSSVSLVGAGTINLLPPASGNFSIQWPSSVGSSGQVLSTDGTGALDWVSAPVNSGIFLAASGSAGTPGVAFNSDPDTGFFNPGANTFGISVGGTERLRLNSGGSMGLGTTNPVFFFHARKDQNTSTQFQFQNFNAGASAFSRIATGSDVVATALNSYSSTNAATRSGVVLAGAGELNFTGVTKSLIGNFDAAPIYLLTNDAIRMTVGSLGDVGIGTTGVSAGNLLEVTGGAIATGNNGELRFMELIGQGTNFISFLAPGTLAVSQTFRLPATDGTFGASLQTDGAGNLSFQRGLVGRINYAGTGGCLWGNSATTAWHTIVADNDCPAPTMVSGASAPGTKIPGIIINSMPAGDYELVVTGQFFNQNGGTCRWRLTDGSSYNGIVASNLSSEGDQLMIAQFSYTTSANRTFQIEVQSSVGTGDDCYVANDEGGNFDFQITVKRL